VTASLETSAPIAPAPRSTGVDHDAARALRELDRWLSRLRFDDLHELVADVYARGSQRSYVRLPSGQGCEAWLICWPPGSQAPLHDHGGAAGFASVLTGWLRECLYPNGRDAAGQGFERAWRSGAIVRVDPHACHEVSNISDSTAYSLHVYQPRLRSMTYYERTASGELRPVHSEAVT
jgi:predicted metal-dependent enzyme (double-stranded beta helix superfamily)